MATPETAPPADLTSLAHAVGRIEGVVNTLAVGQRSLADDVRALAERQQGMAEDIRALAEGQRALAEGQRALADRQNAFEEETRSGLRNVNARIDAAAERVNQRIDRVLQVGIVSGATVTAAMIGAIVAVALIG